VVEGRGFGKIRTLLRGGGRGRGRLCNIRVKDFIKKVGGGQNKGLRNIIMK